jgi:hypothetical protein
MASKATMGCISMKSISSSIISLVLHFGVSSFPAIFAQVNTCSCYYLHSQIDADKEICLLIGQSPSKFHPSWKKNRRHFYSIQVRSSFLIQVSCMVYTIKKLEFKKLEWRLGCKTCIVYTGLKSKKWTCNHINMKQTLSHNVVLNTPHLE